MLIVSTLPDRGFTSQPRPREMIERQLGHFHEVSPDYAAAAPRAAD
jgi:hypothetical protein